MSTTLRMLLPATVRAFPPPASPVPGRVLAPCEPYVAPHARALRTPCLHTPPYPLASRRGFRPRPAFRCARLAPVGLLLVEPVQIVFGRAKHPCNPSQRRFHNEMDQCDPDQ